MRFAIEEVRNEHGTISMRRTRAPASDVSEIVDRKLRLDLLAISVATSGPAYLLDHRNSSFTPSQVHHAGDNRNVYTLLKHISANKNINHPSLCVR